MVSHGDNNKKNEREHCTPTEVGHTHIPSMRQYSGLKRTEVYFCGSPTMLYVQVVRIVVGKTRRHDDTIWF